VGRRLEIPVECLRQGVTREQISDGLRPLLALPVAHGSRRTAGLATGGLKRAIS
jgi:hypothetical protein